MSDTRQGQTPAAPKWLGAEGLTVWNRFAPSLAAAGRLDEIGVDTSLASYCRAVTMVNRLGRALGLPIVGLAASEEPR